MLRIIAGKNRGKNILFKIPSTTRPTSSMVKEAVFNILQCEIADSTFLDLFFGSGQMGLEALSRGAKHVTFVDSSRYCKECLTSNLKAMGIDDGFEIISQDAQDYIFRSGKKFDIIFLDPPYNLGFSEKILNTIVKNIEECGIIVVETEKQEKLNETYQGIEIQKEYIYGKKKITIYRKQKI